MIWERQDTDEIVPSWWRTPSDDIVCAHHACLIDIGADAFVCEPLTDDEVCALGDGLVCAECGDPAPMTGDLCMPLDGEEVPWAA